MAAMVQSASQYSFRSICPPNKFNTAGQYPSTELLAPAVILTTTESPTKSTLLSKFKKFAGKARKNNLSKSTSHADLLSPSSPVCSLARSTNTLSHYPLRSSFDHPRSLTMSPPRRTPRQSAFNGTPMTKSPSTQSKVSIRDIQDFASTLFVDEPSTPAADMAREWTLRCGDVYPRNTPRSRSSSFNHTPAASTTSSARSSFSGGPATPPESYLLPFWAQEEKEKVTLSMGSVKRPISPTVMQSGWLVPVPLDGIWCMPEEDDDEVLQRELKRVMGVAI